ncbi:hypothetical protein B0J13DRAFT_602198 [Dactylonectria estremocensis]|uniref:Uncharacterized protein n=1 Tax=Dactylonectria estremocensis TaxID=1079267 RepID=A0A9P9FCV6_9HYPO|nr:hypothetical protein B0J13DRAFT_602198 [Dactylonectria estremocensis]
MSSPWSVFPLTWLITGAASGFGLELTRLALSNGHKVIATSRNPARNPELVSEIKALGGDWRALDVDDLDCGAFIRRIEDEGTGIDILVNNAGWSIHGPAESFAEDEIRRQMETVFFGPYRLVRAALPYMRQRRRGMIVNMSTGAGVMGRESMGIYGASKAAMDGLVKILAREVSPFNIRTLTVHLGGFDTNFSNAVQTSSQPPPADYSGSMTEKVLESIRGGNFQPDGDHRKAAKAIYEVIVGEGLGKNREGERVMHLGRDMSDRMGQVLLALNDQMATFDGIARDVYLNK